MGAITDDEIVTALVTILAAAFDFWTVKNITGRLDFEFLKSKKIDFSLVSGGGAKLRKMEQKNGTLSHMMPRLN